MSLFPIIQPEVNITETTLPLYKEIEWDFKQNKIIYKNGSPSIVTGKDAVLIWALKALRIKRARYEIYSWDYGNETENLIGQPFTHELKRSEAIRYVKECLMVNPYITDVSDIQVDFKDDLMSVQCKIDTIYGEVVASV